MAQILILASFLSTLYSFNLYGDSPGTPDECVRIENGSTSSIREVQKFIGSLQGMLTFQTEVSLFKASPLYQDFLKQFRPEQQVSLRKRFENNLHYFGTTDRRLLFRNLTQLSPSLQRKYLLESHKETCPE